MAASLIQAALNGPRFAMTPESLAAEARAAVDAGARSLHLHPYDATGRESVHADDVSRALTAVRRQCPEVEVGVSTGAWIEADMPAAIARWRDPLPDMASVNLSEPKHLAVMHALLDRGIQVEAGICTLADVDALRATALADACHRIMVEIDLPVTDQAAEAAAIDAALDQAGMTAVARLHHGLGAGTWDVLRQAIAWGRDVRVGLEDTTQLPNGSVAVTNSALVAAAAALADPDV